MEPKLPYVLITSSSFNINVTSTVVKASHSMANKPTAHVLAIYLYSNLALWKDSCSKCKDMAKLTLALHIWFLKIHKNKHLPLIFITWTMYFHMVNEIPTKRFH